MSNASRFVLLAFAWVLTHTAHGQRMSPDIATTSHHPSFLISDRLPAIDLSKMPSPYSYEHLGIFCKAEVKMNRWLPIPVMVRLGDVERAEELDGKGAFRQLH